MKRVNDSQRAMEVKSVQRNMQNNGEYRFAFQIRLRSGKKTSCRTKTRKEMQAEEEEKGLFGEAERERGGGGEVKRERKNDRMQV